MNDVLNAFIGKAKELWTNITVTQRMLVGGLAVLVIAMFIGIIVWMGKTEYRVLYSNLVSEDANKVVKTLEAQQVAYKLEETGNNTTILVPETKVHALRLGIAGENTLTGQGIGFELFNDVKVGQTEFVQKLNYRRALEGELARTISQFPSVATVRVHLVIPNRSLFIEEQQKPSASVLLKLEGNKKIEAKDVQAVVNLIAMAVEGLEKSRISIADTSGKVLFEPEAEGSLSGMTQTQLEHKLLVQKNLERRIEELLMPVIGAGRVIAKVNAEMDFSQKTIRKELYDPEQTVVRSESRSEESTQGNGNISGGVPDPNFRSDGFSGSTSSQQGTRETRSTNYEINKEEQNIITSAGDINRITVAVIIDGTYQKNAQGEMVFVPRKAEELTRIRQLVSNAVGFDSARGDTIEVSNIPFEGVEIAPEDTMTSIIADYALRFGKPLMTGILAFIFMFMVVRPVILALVRPKVEGSMIEGLEGLPPPEEKIALAEYAEEDDAVITTFDSLDDIRAHAVQLSEQNMDQALGILKSWMKEPAVESLPPARAA